MSRKSLIHRKRNLLKTFPYCINCKIFLEESTASITRGRIRIGAERLEGMGTRSLICRPCLDETWIKEIKSFEPAVLLEIVSRSNHTVRRRVNYYIKNAIQKK